MSDFYRLRFALCDNSTLFRLQNCPGRCMLRKIVPWIQGTLLAPSAPGETPRSRDLPPKLIINYRARMGHKSSPSARRRHRLLAPPPRPGQVSREQARQNGDLAISCRRIMASARNDILVGEIGLLHYGGISIGPLSIGYRLSVSPVRRWSFCGAPIRGPFTET